MGDTGGESVVRMAATTPALKMLNLHSACVCVRAGFALRGVALLMGGLCVCVFKRPPHQTVA